MVIGIISKSFTAETLLNNLSEADFDLRDVSVVMKDAKARDAIAKDAGPFKGVALADLDKKLAQAGLSQQEVDLCSAAVKRGKVLLAMTCPKESMSAAAEMFKDMSAEFVKVFG